MRKKRRKNRIIASVFAIFLLVAGYFSFVYQAPKESSKTVTIGVVGQTKEDAQIWDSVAKTAKAKYGITIQIKNFTDYNQPNKALLNGDIDLNAFQHFAFLDAWNKANKADIVSIGKTIIAPIRLYSLKYKSINSLPDGATIAVPNDASNESRALYVLKNAGLIKLKSGKKIVSVADITSNPKNLQIKEVAADQAGRIIKSVDAAVVNNSYAAPAGLGDKQTIYVEPVNKDSEQWINLIAARKNDKNKQIYLDVVKAYQTKKTKELVKKYYGNTELTGWDIKIK
ncbi:MetQ/NlpA family ABC transporter substrate-binding protein [Lactobacillus mulieris]|uniref:Lipoprotein n=1 Tax=Lactobacillus mulieris TaxID=2508708 RepID=A0AAP3GVC2_9LACO|nr:MetQ/NlpA family ABC transporter substrate-binding protein [Lactobacillus mulieris]MCZ3844195.1 MetQ/NlpA family ABC transporter substrate-binding protein [Lactobacillus mulieris]MCZ3875855.1 MetQ/NlpA family ABC transporter substrate-binding protein [Lactobacillus mulieris]MCZ3899293.1 MetQ/NlpA family ABC transporter substrate-binding protein [Lactobacillus mulieris]MCZ9648660.1 MetQ/NlpA family ABC transporter substrate-binding protein [Lactobacillus mulieris]MCZ9718937.1 MetQ/NlpA famil